MPIAVCRRCERAYVTDSVAGDWRCPVCARPLVEGTRDDARRFMGRSQPEPHEAAADDGRERRSDS